MRVVSLVPSATETLLALDVVPVACTRYCEQPGVATVGGTKNPDVAAIVALEPDLVIVNDEENRREDADTLAAAGLTLHSMSPRAVDDVGPAIGVLARLVGRRAPEPFMPAAAWRSWRIGTRSEVDGEGTARRGCTLVWRRPWMTLAGDTYGASLLALVGVEQTPIGDPSARYPEVTLDEMVRAAPDVVLLPSEPYAFVERHRREIADAIPGADAVLIDGRDLFWWGIRTPTAVVRLRSALAV